VAWFQTVLYIVLWGLVLGGLARLAVPGPDPMPAWLTIGIGLAGSFIGGVVGVALVGEPTTEDEAFGVVFSVIVASLIASTLLVVVYRRVVQRRPITGPEAQRFPIRGWGIAKIRRRMGLEEGTPETEEERTADILRKLEELRRAGLLTDEEYERKRLQALER